MNYTMNIIMHIRFVKYDEFLSILNFILWEPYHELI